MPMAIALCRVIEYSVEFIVDILYLRQWQSAKGVVNRTVFSLLQHDRSRQANRPGKERPGRSTRFSFPRTCKSRPLTNAKRFRLKLKLDWKVAGNGKYESWFAAMMIQVPKNLFHLASRFRVYVRKIEPISSLSGLIKSTSKRNGQFSYTCTYVMKRRERHSVRGCAKSR